MVENEEPTIKPVQDRFTVLGQARVAAAEDEDQTTRDTSLWEQLMEELGFSKEKPKKKKNNKKKK